jgi:ATP-dependent Zn protease
MNTDIETMKSATAPLHPLALLASGKTGADIERIVRELRARCRRQKLPLTWSALEDTLRPSRGQISDALQHQIAVHEIGHALTYELTGVGKVATVRIFGLGGVTETSISPEHIQFFDGIIDYLACLLGGRAAESIAFGRTALGSAGGSESDLAKASRTALDMETIYGIGSMHPLVYRQPSNPGDILNYHPNLAERVQQRLAIAEARALDILMPHRDLVESLGRQLAAKQVLEGVAIREAIRASGTSKSASES